jgi:hypothetical protein
MRPDTIEICSRERRNASLKTAVEPQEPKCSAFVPRSKFLFIHTKIISHDSLQLTDACVKNGGDHFLVEIASREFIDNLVSILKVPGLNHDVKNAILRAIQNWSIAFEGRYALGYVGQVYKTLQGEGVLFWYSSTSPAYIQPQGINSHPRIRPLLIPLWWIHKRPPNG